MVESGCRRGWSKGMAAGAQFFWHFFLRDVMVNGF
jgi:hypothetical protein